MSFHSQVSAEGDGEAVITNQSKLPMAAWIFEILREPCNPIEAGQHAYLGYDSASVVNGALQPSASKVQDIGASHCNKIGTHSPNRASLKVALFADGSFVGDPGWLNILRQNREARLDRVNRAIEALKKVDSAQTREQCLAYLDKARYPLPAEGDPHVEYSVPDPFDAAIRKLTADRSTSLRNQIAELLTQLEAERGRLESQKPRRAGL
ncbi:MAG: hypothetical protein WA510_28800 [Acidobacteriaceae bacterium]